MTPTMSSSAGTAGSTSPMTAAKTGRSSEIGLAQFYAITADMRKPYYVYGGLQDNGNWGGPSRSRRNSGIVNNDWFPLSNADGFFSQVDPDRFQHRVL